MMKDTLDNDVLLEVNNLTVRFAVKRGGGWGQKSYLYAVDDISFDIKRGETLAIVGESGSGKTTAALAVARLVNAYKGKVELNGTDFLALKDEALRQARTRMQVIFQDPYSSLNPRVRAEKIVREPLDNLDAVPNAERQAIVDKLFEAVGLHPEQQRLFPHQFSGGQRQRIGIARALATQPDLIICDEPVSALDVAVQAQILNLLRKLQSDIGLTYLFISHDLGVVQHMCDSIAVMYMGKIVEHADRLSLFNNPLHPYTAALLSAVPSVDKKRREATKRILIPGDPPDPLALPKGCRFANRCPVAQDRCKASQPDLIEVVPGHKVACHLVDETAISPL
jgi:peptide/nickel transport system ATP-binding protein